MGLLSIFDQTAKDLKKFEKIADKILELEEEFSKLSDNKLKNKTIEFKQRIANGETLEDLVVEAFATAREASYRVLKEKPFKVQVVGALALHYGNIAEMKTGEGKTLTSVMTAYLNALSGDGVHIITVNESLANRDANWMGKIHEFLGLTVGVNIRDLTPKEKQEAYKCDITYTTNNELGFDYLRDNMVVKKEDRTQRNLSFAIVDEVDSILIDEARTPLIISGGVAQSSNIYIEADKFAKTLKIEKDYTYDEKTKEIALTSQGSSKCEESFNIENLYDIKNSALVHHVNKALQANYTMKKDFDYVVQEDEVIIVDQFTGRLMQGRAYSEGLHQAIEAKEGVNIQQETKTLATITFQNLFRMYKKLSGMTGTAKTEEEEFRNIYNMYVIEIETNRKVIRIDESDLIYATEKGKFKAVINEIVERNAKGQPMLIGTVAIETSELLSSMLKKEGIKHEVLNAKNHEREAEMIAKAGAMGSVTIATNMAGRGTDIKLGEGVKELGGLCVLGTERHESRRIDNQLRGRAGRQGDPGYSQFFVSFEDELMRRFGTDRAKGMLQAIGFKEDQCIRSKTLSKSIESAQKRVEGNNFDTRKNLLQYDDVMNDQREIIYEKRNTIIDSESIHEDVIKTIKMFNEDYLRLHYYPEEEFTEDDIKETLEFYNNQLLKTNKIKKDTLIEKSLEEIIEEVNSLTLKDYNEKLETIPKEILFEFEKAISLNVIDTHWMEHIDTIAHLKEGIHLRSYAQHNALTAYTKEGFELFDQMIETINKETTMYLFRAEIRQNVERKQVIKGTANSDKSKETKKSPKRINKTGRNEQCPCGSAKKYKNCCGK